MSFKSIDPIEHYKNYKDLYHEFLTVEHFEGIEIPDEWCLLEAVPKPPEGHGFRSAGGIILDGQGRQSRVPIVWRVVQVGPAVSRLKTDDLVCPIMSAGVNFGSSLVALVKEKDIIFTWGQGIKREPEPELDSAMTLTGLDRLRALGIVNDK